MERFKKLIVKGKGKILTASIFLALSIGAYAGDGNGAKTGFDNLIKEMKTYLKTGGGIMIVIGLIQLVFAIKDEDGGGKSKAIMSLIIGGVLMGAMSFLDGIV